MPSDELNPRLKRLTQLRKVGVRRGAAHLKRPELPPAGPAASSSKALPAGASVRTDAGIAWPSPASEITALLAQPAGLPGEEVQTRFGPAWVRTVRYPLSERPELAGLLAVAGAALAAVGRDASLLKLDPAAAAFVDTETTGLSIGAATYTFLIGIGTYEPLAGERPALASSDPGAQPAPSPTALAFVVRQFFMRNPGEERAQLHLVDEVLGRCTGIVSFNGRSFDLPLIQNRFILARMPLPLVAAPHLDLLPAARRVWRGSLDSCRLGSLEQHVLGVQRSEEDVPGWLIPNIYRDYCRTGVATDLLGRVFYHNLTDITSLSLLAAHLTRFFASDDPTPHLAGLRPLERANLAHCYEALDWPAAGIAAFRAALAGPLADADRLHALRSLGALFKRLGRYEEAVAVWEEWISSLPGDDLTPYVELAKYHEWATGDLAAARGWAAWALRIVEGWPPGQAGDEAMRELRHRLERLERKRAGR